MYPVFTCMPGESYCRWLRSLLLRSRGLFWVPVNSIGHHSYLYHGAMGNLPMKSNLLAMTQPSCFEAGMFSTGQPFLSLISLTVSVDVMHHVYFIGQPHLDILLRCPALNTKGQVSSELPSSTCTTWDKTSAPWHMHGIGESWIPESVALPESRTSVTGEQALSHVHNGYTMRKASEKSLITTTTTKNKTNQQWFPSGHDLRLSIVLRLLQYTLSHDFLSKIHFQTLGHALWHCVCDKMWWVV